MNKKSAIRIICFSLSFAVMVFIFVMSAKNAFQSSQISQSFTRRILQFLLKGFGSMTVYRQDELIEGLQFVIRKSAHAFVFTVLGSLLAGGFLTFDGIRRYKSFFIPFGCSVLYAISDEFHQLFVQGRSCEIWDILIDSTGAAIGIIVVIVIRQIVKKNKPSF